MHFKSVNSQSPPTVICKSVTVHTQHLLQTLRHIQPDVTGQGQGKEASGKMRGGQGTEDYTLLYMFLQWPVYLFCVIYNSPQSLKDLTLLCKQNVVSEMVWQEIHTKSYESKEPSLLVLHTSYSTSTCYRLIKIQYIGSSLAV